jgi:diacylglycerol kinase family enzyme
LRSAAVVFNPLAGKWHSQALLARVLDGLQQSGFEAAPLPTHGPGDAENRARQAAADGAQAIFALGGDGTLRECAAGILGSDVALGFLPTGTMNVMALELGVPGRPVRAARAYKGAREIRLGVGLAEETPFLMQVSAGVDAFLIGSLRSNEKKWLGRAAVVPATLRSLVKYQYPPFEVESASGTHHVALAVASNIVRYGGPFSLTPEASSDGKSLELYLFSGRGRSAAIRFALALLVGRHLKLPGSSVERIQRATITTAANVPLQVDGDVLCPSTRRIRVSLAATTLRVLVPAS